MLLRVVLACTLLTMSVCAGPAFCGTAIHAVSVFKPEEGDLHKYAAVLAATEPIRIKCEAEIKRAMNPLSFWYHKLKGTRVKDPSSVVRLGNVDVDRAVDKFEKRVEEVTNCYGLSADMFNNISYRAAREPFLKQRILLQAYFYRIAADLEKNTKKSFPQINAVESKPRIGVWLPGIKGGSGKELGSKYRYLLYGASRFERFCHALYAIERERIRQREVLQNQLGIPGLPVRMCDPDMLPAMCSEVQTACVRFPNIVSSVVTDCGISQSEFDKLNRKVKFNYVFKTRVQKEISRIDKIERRSRE